MGGAGGNAVPTAPHVLIAVHKSEYALWYAAHVDMPEKAGRLSLTAAVFFETPALRAMASTSAAFETDGTDGFSELNGVRCSCTPPASSIRRTR